jgi:hypothetical protein
LVGLAFVFAVICVLPEYSPFLVSPFCRLFHSPLVFILPPHWPLFGRSCLCFRRNFCPAGKFAVFGFTFLPFISFAVSFYSAASLAVIW